MKAKRHRKFNLFLAVLLCCALPVLILFSCKVQKVGPISPEPVTPAQQVFQYISGQILDFDLNTGLEGVTVTFGTESSTTDADGKFTITSELTAGTYQLVAEKENYLSLYREVEVTEEENITLVITFSMKDINPPVVVEAATGATIEVEQTEEAGAPVDTITVVIPAGALPANTEISITPIPLSTASQLNVADPGFTPVNSISLEPHGTTFTTAIQITLPNLLSPEALQGAIIIVKTIDPNTGIVSVRNEASPSLSTDGTSITYSALHFSNDMITAEARYELSYTTGATPSPTIGYPDAFENGLDCKLDNCENDITTSAGNTGNITVTGSFQDGLNYTNLTNNGGFGLQDVLTLTGESTAPLSLTREKTVVRTTTLSDKVGIKTTVNYTRRDISIFDKTTSTTYSAGYIIVPVSAGVDVVNLGTCEAGHTGG